MKAFKGYGLVGILTVFAFLMISQPLQAQWGKWGKGEKGSGKVVEQKRNLSGFESVGVSSGIDLHITQGNSYSVMVRTDDNIQDKLITEVKNGNLHIKIDGSVRSVEVMEVHVTMPNIRAVAASGGSDVYGKGTINGDNLSFAASGGSDIELEVNGGDMDIAVSGGSDIVLSGRAKNISVAVSGGSDLKAKNLMTSSCSVSASGGSDAWVHASDKAVLNASGGSDIHIYGNPDQLKEHSSSASDIHRM